MIERFVRIFICSFLQGTSLIQPDNERPLVEMWFSGYLCRTRWREFSSIIRKAESIASHEEVPVDRLWDLTLRCTEIEFCQNQHVHNWEDYVSLRHLPFLLLYKIPWWSTINLPTLPTVYTIFVSIFIDIGFYLIEQGNYEVLLPINMRIERSFFPTPVRRHTWGKGCDCECVQCRSLHSNGSGLCGCQPLYGHCVFRYAGLRRHVFPCFHSWPGLLWVDGDSLHMTSGWASGSA